jgi:hypothetical protein
MCCTLGEGQRFGENVKDVRDYPNCGVRGEEKRRESMGGGPMSRRGARYPWDTWVKIGVRSAYFPAEQKPDIKKGYVPFFYLKKNVKCIRDLERNRRGAEKR